LTKIKLALEILHTRSNTAQDSPKKSIQHLEEETIEEEIKSDLASKQEKPQHQFNRCLSIGASEAYWKNR